MPLIIRKKYSESDIYEMVWLELCEERSRQDCCSLLGSQLNRHIRRKYQKPRPAMPVELVRPSKCVFEPSIANVAIYQKKAICAYENAFTLFRYGVLMNCSVNLILHQVPITNPKTIKMKAPEKKIGLAFWQLTPTATESEQEEIEKSKAISIGFSQAHKKNNFSPLDRDDGTVNLHGKLKASSAGYILGTIVNNQMTDIPPSYDNETHALSQLRLSETQGLGHPTSFLFDYQINVLMIEVVRNGVGVGAFCKYFRQNLGLPLFDASVVINPADYEKFNNMTHIRTFEVKIARVENGSIFSTTGKSRAVGQIIDSADNTNTKALVYRLTAPRKESLKLNQIKNFVNGFLKFKDTEEVTALKVTGKEVDDDNAFPIDFIQQRLKDSMTVERERLIGNFDIQGKFGLMEQVYAKHRAGLLRTFKK